ncbi:MAG: hypothetical protein JSR98_01345 [Proteobacteria bacterium]|nr:hypothetical protein [Pseudomonadota bacterium]
MTLWLLLLGGLLLILLVVAGLFLRALDRAERRARRGLYRNLGLEDVTVDFLMERNRGVLAEITFVRGYGEAAVRDAQVAAAEHSRNVKLLRPQLQVVARDASSPGADQPRIEHPDSAAD